MKDKIHTFSKTEVPFKRRGCQAFFKVWPGKHIPYKGFGGYYWHVCVFKDKSLMKKAFRDINKIRGDDDKDDQFGAIVMPMERQVYIRVNGRSRWVSDGCLGFVLFAKSQFGGETIAHESVHMATNFWLRAKPQHINLLDKNGEKNDDEPLAYATGQCTRQIVKALYRHKIMK